MSELLKISLPDGSVREMPLGSTPADVAAAIGPGLAKAALAARVDGDLVELNYSDDGIGMDSAALAQLFDPFYTTKRGTGGSGLGAHILYNLVTGALGGTVKVLSSPGLGLHYKLRFPKIQRKVAA